MEISIQSLEKYSPSFKIPYCIRKYSHSMFLHYAFAHSCLYEQVQKMFLQENLTEHHVSDILHIFALGPKSSLGSANENVGFIFLLTTVRMVKFSGR